MLPACIHRSRLALALLTSTRTSRCISSLNHFTPAERQLFLERMEAKDRLPSRAVPQKPSAPQLLRPQIFHPQPSTWVALENNSGEGLERGRIVKVVSWNILWSNPDPAARTSAALGHLNELFGEVSRPLVVMLQEVRRESLQVILNNAWVQRNFILSNVDPPASLYTDIPGKSFILRQLDWNATPYFTLVMISRQLAITNCFRVPFVTSMGRDALVIDIPVSNPGGRTQMKESLRLCTTHLESLWGGKGYRPGQLALISALLKGTLPMESRIIAGLVGEDMNAIDKSEHEFHKSNDVNLNDAWEDVPAPPVPILKHFQKDFSYGRARGNTWGYQSDGNRDRKRMDKFFYTGSIETVAITETQDITGRIGRLGIDVKTDVETWEHETTKWSLRRGSKIPREGNFNEEKMVCKTVNAWVSDHFGIAVGIKVP